jgi:hypothetical protein
MPRCQVCAHRRLADLNEALLRGESGAEVARRFRLSAQAVNRHVRNDHVPKPVSTTVVAEPTVAGLTAEARLEALELEALALMRQARSNPRVHLAAVAECRRIVETLAKVRGEMREAPVAVQVVLTQTPEWADHVQAVARGVAALDETNRARYLAAVEGAPIPALPDPNGGTGDD